MDTLAITDPRFATKLVGQVGGSAIGALATEDAETSILLPGRQGSPAQSFDFSTCDELLRYRYDAGASAFGVYASDRDGAGHHSGLYAADAYWQVDPSDALTVLVGSSSTDYPQEVASAFGQGQDVRNNTSLYPHGAPPRTGTLATQWLLGYQINPWTVFYAGSSEGYQETPGRQLVPQQRTFFLKGSYYFQPF